MERPVKYICLIYDDEKSFESLPQEQVDAVMGEYFDLSDALTESGQLIAAEALQPVASATVVRVRSGRLSTPDGP